MTKYAILGDIHGNLEAFEAVLQDISTEKIDKIAVLGDSVGYGPNPRECLEKVFEIADIFLIGNHEKEVISPDPTTCEGAKESSKWTRTQLNKCKIWEQIKAAIKKEGNDSWASKDIDGKIFVHGSPYAPTDQYVCPDNEHDYLMFNDKVDERIGDFLKEFTRNHSFCAHTHVPAVLTAYENRSIFNPYTHELKWNKATFIGPHTIYFVPEGNITLEGLAGKKMVINPGSVGQPRDGNPAASYAIYDGNIVKFRRIPYDFKRTQQKIMELPIDASTKKRHAVRLSVGM